MRPELVQRLFEMQKKIDKIINPLYEDIDQGMFVPQDEEPYWRDTTCFNDPEKVYSFSFSSDGDYEGDLLPDCALEILTIFESYKR